MHGLGLTNRKGGIIKRRHRFQLNHLNSTHAIFLQMSLISGLPYLRTQKALISDSTKRAFLSAEGSTGWKLNSATTLYHPSVLLLGFVLAASSWCPQPFEVQSCGKTQDWDGTTVTRELASAHTYPRGCISPPPPGERNSWELASSWLHFGHLSNRPSWATDAFYDVIGLEEFQSQLLTNIITLYMHY